MVTACIISKNEEKNIERCLEALVNAGFEISLVDTGSTDRTVELAGKYTDNIHFFEWCNDFSKAKNYAVEMAKSQYVMVVDCDEFVISGTAEELEKQMKSNPGMIGRILLCNQLNDKFDMKNENREWCNRIFDKTLFHYEGKIHEQIKALNKQICTVYKSCMVIEHVGYNISVEERDKKVDRNVGLLLKELKEYEAEPVKYEEELPYIYYQLGKSFYMKKDLIKAIEYFEKATVFDLNPDMDYVVDLVETYGYALVDNKKFEKALSFEGLYEVFGKTADFQFLMGLIYMNCGYIEKAIEEFLKATKNDFCKCVGVNSYFAYFNIGVIYECIEDYVNARKYYELCGDFAKARERLDELEK